MDNEEIRTEVILEEEPGKPAEAIAEEADLQEPVEEALPEDIDEEEIDVLGIALKAVSEKKASRILVYDTEMMTPYMDRMVVASTDNVVQNNAIAQNVKDRLYEAGYKGPFRLEGTRESKWILVDLKDIIIHLFTRDERDLYQIDRLYADCPVEEYDV